MSMEFAADFREFDNNFLPTFLDVVSANIGAGAILQEVNSGRDSSGGVTFTPNTDASGFNYELFIAKQFTAQSTRIVGGYIDQDGNTQGTLGGRLLTFVDSTESVFGATVQVAINIMDDNTLQATRATVAFTGIVLRGTDQGGDAQMTLLGASSETLSGAEYVEVKVVHHPTAGSIEVWVDNVAFWSLTNVNTAISGQNRSTTVLWGGYGVTGDGDDVLHHEDLAAIISDVVVINGTVNPDDPNDPTDRIGAHKPLLSLPTADANYAQYTPDPSASHFANVDEIPPDSADSQNSAAATALRDNFAMQDVAGTSENTVYLAYTGFVKADTQADCGVSDTPANFEAFVYTEQTDPGEVHTTPPTGPPCNLSDFVSRRAQTVCTIGQDGEKVTFKLLNASPPIDAYFVGLSPLDTPPRLQVPQAPGYNAAAGFHPTIVSGGGFGLALNLNTTAIPGSVRYDLPWYQPWQGWAADTQDELRLAGDAFTFELNEDGIGIDVGIANNSAIAAPFNPYTTPLVAFHFREDLLGSPYFWISPSFGYANETVYTHSPGDRYSIIRNDPNIELYQNATLLETFTPGGPLDTILNCYTFMGRWGYAAPFGYIRQPGIKNAFVQIGSSDCCPAHYDYPMLSTSYALNAPELQQWGIFFNSDFNEGLIYDPGSTHGPWKLFGYTADTRMEFSLESGNVVLRVYDFDYLSGIPDVGGVGTWTYTVPYANTNNFAIQGSPIAVGPPDYPHNTLEYDFPTPGANAPLRLVVIFGADNGGITQGLTNVSFTFLEGVSPSTFTGFMRQGAADRDGTTVSAPTIAYAYRQSFLSSTPTDTPITLGDANLGSHGYSDPEP